MKCPGCGRVSDDVGTVNCAHCAFGKVDSHWMRPELPQGFDPHEVFDLFDRVSHEHWKLMTDSGLPQDPRGRALRAFGIFLASKLTGNRTPHLRTGRPVVTPFANAVGRQVFYRESLNKYPPSMVEPPPLEDWERDLLES